MTDPVTPTPGRVAMGFLIAWCAAVSGMSLVVLAYQSTCRQPDGELFRDTPLAWHHLLGHLIRAVGVGAVGVAILRCRQPTAAAQSAAAAGTFWNRLATYVAASMVHAVSGLWLAAREAAAFAAEGADRAHW